MTWPRRIFFALAAPVAAVVFSLVVSAIVLELSGHSAIDAFKSMWQYTDSTDSVVSTINRALPYYVSALAVAIGFKMNLFNIGVDGQYRMAAVLAAAAGAAVNFTPVIQVSYIILVAVVVGAAWAGDRRDLEGVAGRQRGDLDAHAQRDRHRRACVPAHQLLASEERDRRPRHEDEAVAAVVVHPAAQPVLRAVRLPSPVRHAAQRLRRRRCPPRRRLLRAGVAHPVRLRSASDRCEPGGGPGFGINPKTMILKTMLISGGLAGLVAIGPLLGDPQFHRYNEQFPTTFGFTGIAVALVGRNHPVGIAFSALLFAYIERATQVLALQNIPQEISKIMQGSIILSAVIAYEIVRRVRVAAEVRDAAAKAQPRAAAGGAGGAIPEPVPV